MAEIKIETQQQALDYVRQNKDAIGAALNDNAHARTLSLMRYMATRNKQRYEPSVWAETINKFEASRSKEKSV